MIDLAQWVLAGGYFAPAFPAEKLEQFHSREAQMAVGHIDGTFRDLSDLADAQLAFELQ
jgi:hypothetical protein